MKKILVYIFAFYAATISAATMRHFNFDIDKANIPTELVSEHFEDWFDFPNNTSFVQSNMLSDDDGYMHYCYNQYINGFNVDGGQILVHSNNGIVQYINGIVLVSEETVSPVTNKIARKQSTIDAAAEILIVPVKNKTDFRYAYKYVSYELGAYVYVDTENGDTLKISPFVYDAQTQVTTNTIYSGRQKLSVEKSGSLCTYSVISPRIETINSTNIDFSANTVEMFNTQIQSSTAYIETLADSLSSYLTSVTFSIKDNEWWSDLEEGTTMPDLYLNIYNSSNVLVFQSQIYENWKYIDITFNPMLKLDGDTYTIKIYDQDLVSDDYGGGFTISSSAKGKGTLSLNNFDITVYVTGNPIRDAHWGMEQTLAFYQNILNRSSYDGNGATIYQFVNPFMPQKLPNQAFALSESPYCMVYGLGDGVKSSPLVALDVMAHEFTHMVTAHNIVGGLDYNGESGALNEGFSDIFAVLTEGYTYGQYDWTIGEKFELQNPFTRSFKNPKAGNPSQPTTYGKDPWRDPNSSDDHGGVHYNSGVLNYWFYLLCNGGSGTNDNQKSYSVQGIGATKAAKIAYNTLMYGLTYTATFAAARESSINEAIKLYGTGSQEHQSVVNAWYAVGVGDKYSSSTTPITVKAKMPSNWGSTISAWVWPEGSEGSWVILEKEGDWYSYTTTANPLNIIFVNGTTWNGDNNQTVDIRLEENACVQIDNNTTGKRTYTIIDCPSEEFHLTPGNYIIVTNRGKDGDRNWYYMTSDLGTASTKRFQAVSTGTEDINSIVASNLEDKYVWTLEADGANWKLKNGTKYVTWTSGNSANLGSTAKSLTFDVEENQVIAHFNDGSAERYLSLNAATNNNYFAFYGNTNQVEQLFFIPYNGGTTSISKVEEVSEQGATKILRDGQILILRGDKTYTLTGQRVE